MRELMPFNPPGIDAGNPMHVQQAVLMYGIETRTHFQTIFSFKEKLEHVISGPAFWHVAIRNGLFVMPSKHMWQLIYMNMI